jgi:nucleoside permease NupC
MQFVLGYIVIRTSWGLTAMQFLADCVTTVLGYTYAGSEFVFGWLTDGSLFGRPFQLVDEEDGYFLGPPFFFNVLPTVIFLSCPSDITSVSFLGVFASLVRSSFCLVLSVEDAKGNAARLTPLFRVRIRCGHSSGYIGIRVLVGRW